MTRNMWALINSVVDGRKKSPDAKNTGAWSACAKEQASSASMHVVQINVRQNVCRKGGPVSKALVHNTQAVWALNRGNNAIN